MKRYRLRTFTAIAIMCLGVMHAQADDIDTLLGNVKKNVDEKNYSQDLEELTWLRKEIEKRNSGSMADLLPATLGGMLELIIDKKAADLKLKGLAELLPLAKLENYMRGGQ